MKKSFYAHGGCEVKQQSQSREKKKKEEALERFEMAKKKEKSVRKGSLGLEKRRRKSKADSSF